MKLIIDILVIIFGPPIIVTMLLLPFIVRDLEKRIEELEKKANK